MRRLAALVAGDRRLLALVLVQGATGLAAIAALVYVLQLAPRVNHIEHRVVEVQRIVRVLVRREVVPAKGKPPERGLAGPAPSSRRGPDTKGGGAPGKLPEVGLAGPALPSRRGPAAVSEA